MAQRLDGDGRRVPATPPGYPQPAPARSPAGSPAGSPARRPAQSDMWDSREWRDGLDAPAPRPTARRHRRQARKRNRLAIVITLLAVAVAGGVVVGRMAWDRVSSGLDASAGSADSAGNDLGEPSKPSVVTATAGAAELGPVRGAGTFTYATGTGPVHGSAGPLKRFKVGVENGSGQDVAKFAAAADAAVGDPRGWTGGGQLRLQRVGGSATADFTIFLATPATSEAMCGTGGLHTDQYTSCRLTGKLIINLARWLGGVPGYGASVTVYQQYAINHELGHELGFGHEACPGPGKPAPVMMQQTLGLKGCTANAWPFVDGQRYAGPKVP